MFGAIFGDMIGSDYEFKKRKNDWIPPKKHKEVFTCDTVLTVATAFALLNNSNYATTYEAFSLAYSRIEKGGNSAKYVSPVAYYHDNLNDVLEEAKKSAEGHISSLACIIGTQAVAASVFLARTGTEKASIKEYITDNFNYYIGVKLANIEHKPWSGLDRSCVPLAIFAFLESYSFEDAIQRAISIGISVQSSSISSITCIAGSIAEAYYGTPENLIKYAETKLDAYLLDIVRRFNTNYKIRGSYA